MTCGTDTLTHAPPVCPLSGVKRTFLKRHVVIAVGKDHQPGALGVAVKIKTEVAASMAEAWFV